MKFVFASENRLFYKAFCGILCSEADESVFYENIPDFVTDFLSGKILPDFVIIDGKYFSRFKNFIFRLLRDFDREIPAVFLDGDVPKSLRTAKWLSEIELCFDKSACHNLIPYLEKINRILDLPVCRNAIQTSEQNPFKNAIHNPIQNETKIKEFNIKNPNADTKESESDVNEQKSDEKESNIEKNESGGNESESNIQKSDEKTFLKPKIMLTPVNNLLYDFFFKNRRRIVYIEEIAEILKIQLENEIERERKNGVYAYVSRFRKSISKIECSYELLRICRGGYQLVPRG